MIFRTDYNINEFTSRTLRFNFDDIKKTITLINSYCSKILVINYDELISVNSFTLDVANQYKIVLIKCTDNISIYLLSNKNDYSNIKAFIDKHTGTFNNDDSLRLVTAITTNNFENDFFILVSQSHFDENINKLENIPLNR